MNIKLTYTIGLLSAAAIGLSACGQSQEQLNRAQGMSCTQLAQEIGKYKQQRSSAQADEFGNDLAGALAKTKEQRSNAAVGSVLSSIDEADASQSLEQITSIYNAKGCPAL